MRYLSRVERWVTIAAGVVGIVVAVIGLAKSDREPQQLDGHGNTDSTVPPTGTSDSPVQAPSNQGHGGTVAAFVPPLRELEASRPNTATPPTARRQADEFPVQALLRDGDQRVVLGGDLGVGVAFSEVASTPIATLQINHEGIQETKPLLSSGGAFTLAVRGEQYRISVARLDFQARELQIRIDHLH